MIKINVVIKGLSPLMQHNPQEIFEVKKAHNKGKGYNLEEDCEKRAYRNENDELYIPCEWLVATMRNAARFFKTKRGNPSLKQLISGLITVEPFQISLGTKNYEMDVRRVVIKGASIACARPIIKDWQATFSIRFNPELFPIDNPVGTLKESLEIAGQVYGIGAYRPEHAGPFGRFEITDWKVEEE